MLADSPVALVWRYYAALWNGDTTAGNKVLARTFMYYPPDAAEGLRGRTTHTDYVAWWRRAFPDLHISVLDLLADGAGKKVATRWIVRGTHQGAYAGVPPTGRRITVRGAHFFRMAGGRIQELHSVYDLLALRRQLRPGPVGRTEALPPSGDGPVLAAGA